MSGGWNCCFLPGSLRATGQLRSHLCGYCCFVEMLSGLLNDNMVPILQRMGGLRAFVALQLLPAAHEVFIGLQAGS